MDSQKPELYCLAAQVSQPTDAHQNDGPQSAKTGKWSADGTCIVQVKPDNSIETIILPESLLEDEDRSRLIPYSRYISTNPIYATALYPYFSLGNHTTTLVLYAARENPIQLRNALNYDAGIYATYAWFDPNNEAAITPRSLVFNADATHFVAGSRAKFAIYDVNRPSSRALNIRKTSKSRYAIKMFGEDPHMNATAPQSDVTAMDINSEDVLALGTNTCHIALYADHGLGDLVTSFRLPKPTSDGLTGTRSITQVKWSPDGTYLFIAARQSDTIEIYDIRHNRQRLSWLSGRKANVHFQLSFDVVPTLHGLEVWAGGSDGYLRMWTNPEQQEGEVRWEEQWHVHDDPVCSTLVHHSGSVVATLAAMDRRIKPNHSANSSSEDSNESLSASSADSSDDTSNDDNDLSQDSSLKETQPPSKEMLKIWAIR